MTTGRPPKPVHLKVAEGNPGKRSIRAAASIAPLSELPEPPEDLAEYGQTAWDLVGNALTGAGSLQSHYLPMLHAFAQACEMAHEARLELAGQPKVRQGRGGGVNPHFRVWKDAAGTARALGEQLGGSPVAMARLGLAQVRGMSMAQELQARKDESERKGRNR